MVGAGGGNEVKWVCSGCRVCSGCKIAKVVWRESTDAVCEERQLCGEGEEEGEGREEGAGDVLSATRGGATWWCTCCSSKASPASAAPALPRLFCSRMLSVISL